MDTDVWIVRIGGNRAEWDTDVWIIERSGGRGVDSEEYGGRSCGVDRQVWIVGCNVAGTPGSKGAGCAEAWCRSGARAGRRRQVGPGAQGGVGRRLSVRRILFLPGAQRGYRVVTRCKFCMQHTGWQALRWSKS